jgi:N-acetylmuramoyl-L-alanine amidase
VNRIVIALLLVSAAAGRSSAQSRTLRIENTAAAVQQVQGQAVLSAAALAPFDAHLQIDGWQARLSIFNDTLVFFANSAFFRKGSRTYQLSGPALQAGSTLLLPLPFFTDWLPAEYSKQLVFRAGALTRSVAAPVVAQRDSASSGSARGGPPPAAKNKPLRVVVLDAGHGGVDSGKPGPNGLAEKTAALAVTNRLAGFLRERGYEVHLTRTADTLIALADRPHFANEWKGARPAAVFVSIHANSGARSAQGFETYFLSDARTDDERRVAEMENAAVQFEKRRADAAPELDQILSGLKNDYYLRASNSLAESIQASLATVHPGPNRGVKQAGFRVLVGALMPAVLVEMAFISNPAEARLLGTSAFQQKVAWSLALAIDRFFDSHEHIWAIGPTQ